MASTQITPSWLGLVRQPRRAGDVADGVEAGHVGPAEAVGHDVAAVDLHAERLEPEVLGIADDADGEDHALGRRSSAACRPSLDRGGDAVAPLLEPSSPWRR